MIDLMNTQTSSAKNFRSMIDIITCNGSATPIFLFEEYSCLEESLKDDVKRYCMKGDISHLLTMTVTCGRGYSIASRTVI